RANVQQFVKDSFLDAAQSPIVEVSAQIGQGIEELKQAMVHVAQSLPARPHVGLLRLPIDRVFTMKGFGTVVTGTLSSGTVRVGDEVEVLPATSRARVRGVQVHNVAVDAAHAGERTALNIAGVEKADLARG